MTPEEYRDQVNGEPERRRLTGHLTFAFKRSELNWTSPDFFYARVLDAYEALVNKMLFEAMFTFEEFTPIPLTPLEEAEYLVDELFDDAEGYDE